MHTKPLSLARKFVVGIIATVGLLLLAGCDMSLTNLTPPSLPENPSQIYTLSLRVSRPSGNIVKESVTPYIVINGQNFKMTRSSLNEDLFDFDYQLPAGSDTMKYYFLVHYKLNSNGYTHDREAYTDIKETRVARRYVLSLEVTRGPIGARVSVLGRGFTPQDVVALDGTPARTVYESANSLSFFVPAVAPNKNYKVTLSSPAGNSPVGAFRVDSAALQVSPSSLNLRPGEKQSLTFTLPQPASGGGVLLDVTTDIPESVIMPEVIIPAGQSSATITVQGGKKGSGTLYLKGFGQGEILIPVVVQ